MTTECNCWRLVHANVACRTVSPYATANWADTGLPLAAAPLYCFHWQLGIHPHSTHHAEHPCVALHAQEPTCVIVKHTNPCGVASAGSGRDLLEAYRAAVRADPVSAFGGIVAFNVPVDADLAREIREFR